MVVPHLMEKLARPIVYFYGKQMLKGLPAVANSPDTFEKLIWFTVHSLSLKAGKVFSLN